MGIRELELVNGAFVTRLGQDSVVVPPVDPVDPGNVPGWGTPAWRDERADRKAFGLTVDPTQWNVRGTEVNNFDYAIVDPNMVSVDTDGYMHIKSAFLGAPQHTQQGGTVTASSSDTLTSSVNHGFNVADKVYVEHISGGGITTGYYYVKTKTNTTLTLTTTCDLWPGGLGATYNVTADSTVKLYRPRFMRTGYVDHRIISGGDVQPLVQQYGRWEVRAKPCSHPTQGRGVLAAFWLRNSGTITVGGNGGAEIDITESWGSGPTAKFDPGISTLTFFKYTVVPTGGTQGKEVWKYDDASKAPAGHNDAYADFHTWTFERMPTYMKAWRDGVLICNETPASSPDSWTSTATNPFHMRMNLHMGASAQYWGIPDPAHPEWSALGMDYVIDYVRAWSPAA